MADVSGVATIQPNSQRHEPERMGEGDAVAAALARGLAEASAAGRWDVVAQLARELEARRTARAGNVVLLESQRRMRR
jgi:hypothetical protein